MKSPLYISVRDWRKFQHYDPEKRVPPWIKNHTELMSSDAYQGLTAAQRGVLHGIWLEYASSRCALPGDTLTLTRRIGVKVSRGTLDTLIHAGFIDIVASKLLAEGYQAASASRARREGEEEGEREKTTPPTPPQRDETTTTVGGDFTYEPEHPENLPPELASRIESATRVMPV
jgi:hypothetical protein